MACIVSVSRVHKKALASGRLEHLKDLIMNRASTLGAVAIGSLSAIAFWKLVRPWYLTWDASDLELARPMPLDERVLDPTLSTTMAITVTATPEAIWPWLGQMGEPPRAGFYSYTWIERLAGMHITNAAVVSPQIPVLQIGDALDRAGSMIVLGIESDRFLVLGPADSVEFMKCTWAIGLYPVNEQTTRLVMRVRARFDYRRMLAVLPPFVWPMWLFIEPGSFIMQRKMLLELKRRAESTMTNSRTRTVDPVKPLVGDVDPLVEAPTTLPG